MSRAPEGRLLYKEVKNDGGIWLLDAEPHVMAVFSRLFPVARLAATTDDTEFTHRPRQLQDGLDARRDLDWFLQRYVLEVSPQDRKKIKNGKNRFEQIMAATEKAYHDYTPPKLSLAMPLRDYQLQACSLFEAKKCFLLADQVGLGKTPTAIACASNHLPALCVVPPHLVTQWREEIKKFLPEARVHLIYGRKNYDLPEADFYVTAYSRIAAWADHFGPREIKLKTLILDEVHELRNSDTQKHRGVKSIADHTEYRLGLSATPVMNYGIDVYNIFQVIDPNKLGSYTSFSREWCNFNGIRDPKLFGHYLRKNFMMVRRTREDVKLELEPINRIVYTVDADMATLQNLEKEATQLAMQVVSGDFKMSGQAARELDWKLRHATGLAKARATAEIVKMLVEAGEKVALFGWHKDVYSVWRRELAALNPVFYTGSESVAQKNDALERFRNGDAQVFVMSLRSGAGLNGLQDVSSYAVVGELDWSPGIQEQCLGRLWRDGSKKQVTAIFVTINDGSDPVMIKTLGLKASEAKQIVNPKAGASSELHSEEKRVREMARSYLKAKGIDPPVASEGVKKTGDDKQIFIDAPDEKSVEGDLLRILREASLSTNDEALMQEEIERALKAKDLSFDREKRIDGGQRLDFMVEGHVAVECKVHGATKRGLLRQLIRYKESCPEITSFVIVTPWSLKHFDLSGTPVYCVDASASALLQGGIS